MTPQILFHDDDGKCTEVECDVGETLFSCLLNEQIPPLSVLVTDGSTPVSLFEQTSPDTVYDVWLLERYDIENIRGLYEPSSTPGLYTSRQLMPHPEELAEKRLELQSTELTHHVEDCISSINTEYQMITEGDTLLVAYSGGIDSTALLLSLASIRDKIPDFSMTVLCIEDYWNRDRPPGQSPDIELLDTLNLDYYIATQADIQEIYGLNEDVSTVLKTLESGGENVLAVASNFNRRVYEQYADRLGVDHICLGNQSTDLLAGFLGDIIEHPEDISIKFPIESAGQYSYIYPLSFHTKQELAAYVVTKIGVSNEHSGFDPWKLTDKDTHYYYYLADIIQSFFPGIIYWIANNPDDATSTHTKGTVCRRCEKFLSDSLSGKNICAVCELLTEYKLIKRDK